MLSAAMPNLPFAVIGFWEACFRSLVLGVLQGLTEFLPISSTAHLKVVPVLLGWGDPGVAVTAVIQLGSIAAVLAYFRSDLAEVIRGVGRACRHGQWGDPSARMGVAIALGTLPIVFAGLALKLWVPDYDNSPLRSMASIAVVSIVMALLLALAELVGSRRRELVDVQPRDGVWVGLAQALALVPGVSRSGSTLTAALFDSWQRPAAARFSFLLGIPAITLAGLVSLIRPLVGNTVTRRLTQGVNIVNRLGQDMRQNQGRVLFEAIDPLSLPDDEVAFLQHALERLSHDNGSIHSGTAAP